MSLERLLDKGMIEKASKDKTLIEKAVGLANRDLKAAKDNLEDGNYEWCLSIAYNAMLQAGRALMFSQGYRPKGKYKHVSVVEFVRLRFGKDLAEQMIFIFNKMRKKRHTIVYEEAYIVSEDEAKNALNWAERFVENANEILKREG